MQLDMKGERWKIRGAVRVVPTAYLRSFVPRPGAYWQRRICMNGTHRKSNVPQVGDFSRDELEQDVLTVDRLQPGTLVQVVSWSFKKDDPGDTVAMARLVSRSTDASFESNTGHYYVQTFQTLNLAKKPATKTETGS